jgi:superoxide dismutase, Cu-Zn family
MIKAAIHHLTSEGVHKRIGYVFLSDTPDGLLLEPQIEDLPPGDHGFHIHQFGDIEPTQKKGKSVAGGAAGEHYDPQRTGEHLGPYEDGHRGDLPRLRVNPNGTATTPVVAPRLKLHEVKNRALIIHSGGDNFSDYPIVNGGGKSRIAGGVITNDCPYCRDETLLTLGKWAIAGAAAWLLLKPRQ